MKLGFLALSAGERRNYIEQAAVRRNVSPVILEKDFWVSAGMNTGTVPGSRYLRGRGRRAGMDVDRSPPRKKPKPLKFCCKPLSGKGVRRRKLALYTPKLRQPYRGSANCDWSRVDRRGAQPKCGHGPGRCSGDSGGQADLNKRLRKKRKDAGVAQRLGEPKDFGGGRGSAPHPRKHLGSPAGLIDTRR
jgi:hypothetical protein